MSKKLVIHTIHEAHELLGLEKPKHPLVSVFPAKTYEGAPAFADVTLILDLYCVTLKSSNACGHIRYGRNSYDYEEGALIFSAPGQVMEYGTEDPDEDDTGGWTLAFHPDLIRSNSLADKIDRYTFFNYELAEALHLSDAELKTIEELVEKIIQEYQQNLDQHSQHLIVSNIELVLDYCVRFYDRQFYTRTNLHGDIISRFEKLLKSYYESNTHKKHGVPTVSYCGKMLTLSPHYLSDLLKKETGKTAGEHIHAFIIDRAKNSLLSSGKSISEIGYDLGFAYPQHFSNLFKSKTGFSPTEFRTAN